MTALRRYIDRRRQKRRERNILAGCGCIAFCPYCRDPLNDQARWSEDEEGLGTYTCTRCGGDSEWHYGIAPGPVLLWAKIARGEANVAIGAATIASGAGVEALSPKAFASGHDNSGAGAGPSGQSERS